MNWCKFVDGFGKEKVVGVREGGLLQRDLEILKFGS